jgi:hypothetical protein
MRKATLGWLVCKAVCKQLATWILCGGWLVGWLAGSLALEQVDDGTIVVCLFVF